MSLHTLMGFPVRKKCLTAKQRQRTVGISGGPAYGQFGFACKSRVTCYALCAQPGLWAAGEKTSVASTPWWDRQCTGISVTTHVKKPRENVTVGGAFWFVLFCFNSGCQGQPAAAAVAPGSQQVLGSLTSRDCAPRHSRFPFSCACCHHHCSGSGIYTLKLQFLLVYLLSEWSLQWRKTPCNASCSWRDCQPKSDQHIRLMQTSTPPNYLEPEVLETDAPLKPHAKWKSCGKCNDQNKSCCEANSMATSAAPTARHLHWHSGTIRAR